MTTGDMLHPATRHEPIAVTGLGMVSPIGFGRQQFWAALCAGQSAIAPIERFPVPAAGPRLGAEVRNFAAREFIASTHLRRMDNLSRMVVAASRMAIDDARLPLSRTPPERVGVVVGSVLGDISESAVYLERVFSKGPQAASPMLFPNLVLNAAASYVSMELGITGINLTVAQGETCGEQAILLACEQLRAGRAEVMLAGGGDELAAIVFESYRLARALSGQRGGTEWSSPYDAGRNGIVLGEGAAMLLLEPQARARTRGATVYALVEDHVMFGVPSRAYDWPATGLPALQPLRRLVGTQPVDLVYGAGNSSLQLDGCELEVFAALFGARAPDVSLTSLKGAVGHVGGAGALSAAAACLALHEQTVPPLCNLRTPARGACLRHAAPQARAHPIDRALVSGWARGGAGAALLLRKH